jgi:site-specific DNA-methyltransferase (cytosine-N4-specific)
VASQAIRILSQPGDLVVDPYCGSGTTLVEAALLGRRSIGIDLSPLAVLIASVKTTPIDPNELESASKMLTEFALGLDEGGLFNNRSQSDCLTDPRIADPWFNKWFQRDVLVDLVALHRAITNLTSLSVRRVALVAFSEVLRRSSNAHQGYPNVMFDRRGKERPRPGRFFVKSLRETCKAVSSLSVDRVDLSHAFVVRANANQLPIADGRADLVVSHPPYIGSIPYAEYGALSLQWLGYDPKHLDKILTGGRRQSRDVVDRFSVDYARMIKSSYRILKKRGFLFLLVGNPTVKGRLVDLAKMTTGFALDEGFELAASTTRSAQNRRANKMGDETILVFRKL